MSNPTYITHDQMKQVLLNKFDNAACGVIILSRNVPVEDYENYFTNLDWDDEFEFDPNDFHYFTITHTEVEFVKGEPYYHYRATFANFPARLLEG